MNKGFSGQVALVTGASRGVGRSTALVLAREGVKLALVARSADRLDEVAAEVARIGVEALVLAADVGDTAQCADVVAKTVQRFGQIDMLINNAARFAPGRLPEIDPEDWLLTLRVNLHGPFALCRAALPHMIERRRGQVISLTSGAALPEYILGGASAYGVSKAGLDHLTRHIAVEAGEYGIRANCVDPGPVHTDMAKEAQALTDAGFWPAAVVQLFQQVEPLRSAPELPARLILWVLANPELNGRIVSILDPAVRSAAGIE